MTIVADADLPLAEAASPQRLAPAVVTVWRLESLVFTAVAVLALTLPLLALGWSLLLLLPVAALGGMEALAMPAARYRAFSYRVGEVDVRIQRGVVWRATSVVLHSRIQHVDTRQGPIERAFGLATVVIFTAGSVGAVVQIPGLAAAQAERLRDRLAALSGREDAL